MGIELVRVEALAQAANSPPRALLRHARESGIKQAARLDTRLRGNDMNRR